MFVTDQKIKLYDGPRFESSKIINFFFISFVYMYLFICLFLPSFYCLFGAQNKKGIHLQGFGSEICTICMRTVMFYALMIFQP